MVEILVVMAIIVVLIGLLIVAAGGARRAAMASTTSSRLDAMSQAVTRFESDAGYLPPLLDNDRAGVDGLEPNRKNRGPGGYPDYLATMQRRYSYTSPAEYLLGYGTEAEDGVEGLGIRRPGEDGFWDASWNDGVDDDEGIHDGRFELRERKPTRSGQRGTVLGPYLELDDPDMVGAIGWDITGSDENGLGQWDGSIDPATNQPMVYFAGDPGYVDSAPKVIVDAWGTPIRYYRVNHPPGQPSMTYPTGYEPVGGAGWRYSPTLSEYFALRPSEVADGESVIWWFDDGDIKWGDFSDTASTTTTRGDPTSTRGLAVGRFAFMSAGPNRRIYDWARVDFPGESLSGLSDARGDHAEPDTLAVGWYDDGKDIPWLGKPAYDAGVIYTEEANIDNIVEIGQ
jgi:type II secretory pathway pseudopilin PulG